MQQLFNQLVQFVQQGIAAIFRFVQLIWTWSVGQITKVIEAPWQNWPLWKQILLVAVAAAVVWALYKAAKELWEAGERTLGAFATLLGVSSRRCRGAGCRSDRPGRRVAHQQSRFLVGALAVGAAARLTRGEPAQSADARGRATSSSGLRSAATPQSAATIAAAIIRAAPKR